MLMLPWVSNRTGTIITRQHTTKPIETDGEEDRLAEQDHQTLDTNGLWRAFVQDGPIFGKLYKSRVNFTSLILYNFNTLVLTITPY
jgi:hypothetical protein